jgi:hypothetical protein
MPYRLTTQGHEGIICPKDMARRPRGVLFPVDRQQVRPRGLYSLKIWQPRPRGDLRIFVDWQEGHEGFHTL